MRALLFCLVLSMLYATPADAPPAREYVHAVEFPYFLYPRPLWERELVWLKSIGFRTVAFSIPWNWHQPERGEFDFTGRTSPRRDLTGFIRLLRRLDMQAWVRPLPPVKGLINAGWPGITPPDQRAQRAWLKELERILAPQTVSHGGPIAFVEGRSVALGAPSPPAPVITVSANDPAALSRSRKALASARGALLWEDVEDALYPLGWEPTPLALVRHGAVGLNGDERPSAAALRRNAALLRNWSAVLPTLQSAPMPKPAAGKWPDNISALEVISPLASAVSLTNSGPHPFSGELRVYEPLSKKAMVIPGVKVPPGESLWLPISLAIGTGGLCRNCTSFSSAEHIVYATAELLTLEYENGILAMEFAAPVAGEVVLQMVRQPSGPLLAGGKPTKFDWDEKTLRARLPIPAGQGAGHRVRIGLAIEAPETSAFFVDARRLVIGKKNVVSTSYSSPELAARSRLRLPEGFTAHPVTKSPVEIDYEVDVPADQAHGDWVNLALEADGVQMGRARLQLFRPASIRWTDAIRMHLGPQTELAVEPPVAPADGKTGRNIEIVVRNNAPGIQTFKIEAAGPGLTFSPASAEISIGPVMERAISMRVFPDEAGQGVRDWRLRVSGGAEVDMPMRLLLIPRDQTVAWQADLDGDGSPEWVLESQKVRAVFSAQDGGRWLEFTWKDTGVNFLPESGAWIGSGPVEVRAQGDTIEFSSKNWKRTVRLNGSRLYVEQSVALPSDTLSGEKRAGIAITVLRESSTRATYTLK